MKDAPSGSLTPASACLSCPSLWLFGIALVSSVKRIGFSFGGEVSHLTALRSFQTARAGDLRFAAHVSYYPAGIHAAGAESYTGAPVLMLIGGRDDNLPEPIRQRDVAKAFYGVVREATASHKSNGDLKEVVADVAGRIDDAVLRERIVNWTTNIDVQNRMRNDIEDALVGGDDLHLRASSLDALYERYAQWLSNRANAIADATIEVGGVRRPVQNVEFGVEMNRVWTDILKQPMALLDQACNHGTGTVMKHGGGMPPIAETQAHVQLVLELYWALLQNNLPRGATTLRMHGAAAVQP